MYRKKLNDDVNNDKTIRSTGFNRVDSNKNKRFPKKGDGIKNPGINSRQPQLISRMQFIPSPLF